MMMMMMTSSPRVINTKIAEIAENRPDPVINAEMVELEPGRD